MLVRVLLLAEAVLVWLVGESVLPSASLVEESFVPMMVGMLLPLVPETLFALVEERPDPVVLGHAASTAYAYGGNTGSGCGGCANSNGSTCWNSCALGGLT